MVVQLTLTFDLLAGKNKRSHHNFSVHTQLLPIKGNPNLGKSYTVIYQ